MEVIERNVTSTGSCLVQSIDGYGVRYEIKNVDLAPLGLHDPESEEEIRKRVEFEKLEELLEKKGCTIEKIEGDGNCLFRAVARHICGYQKEYQRVRDETVDYILSNKELFSEFELEIDKRLLIYRSWGGNLEIAAISSLYDIGILVWKLS